MPPLHHLHDTPFHHLCGVELVHRIIAVFDRPFGDLAPFGMQQVGNRLERRGLARAIAAQQGRDTALGHLQAHALQHQNDRVIDHLDIIDLKKGLDLRVGRWGGIQHGCLFH